LTTILIFCSIQSLEIQKNDQKIIIHDENHIVEAVKQEVQAPVQLEVLQEVSKSKRLSLEENIVFPNSTDGIGNIQFEAKVYL